MRIYVDKNDVDIIEDLFQATNSYECWACNRDDDLEIVSLADYTKQVRKEVCEEIRDKMTHWEDCLTKEVTEYVIDKETLDQIQGEK